MVRDVWWSNRAFVLILLSFFLSLVLIIQNGWEMETFFLLVLLHRVMLLFYWVLLKQNRMQKVLYLLYLWLGKGNECFFLCLFDLFVIYPFFIFSPKVHVTLTNDESKLMNAISAVQIGGECDILATLQLAQVFSFFFFILSFLFFLISFLFFFLACFKT